MRQARLSDKDENGINDLASAPADYIQDIAQNLIGRSLTTNEVNELYCHIETRLNDALHKILEDGINQLFKEAL